MYGLCVNVHEYKTIKTLILPYNHETNTSTNFYFASNEMIECIEVASEIAVPDLVPGNRTVAVGSV